MNKVTKMFRPPNNIAFIQGMPHIRPMKPTDKITICVIDESTRLEGNFIHGNESPLHRSVAVRKRRAQIARNLELPLYRKTATAALLKALYFDRG